MRGLSRGLLIGALLAGVRPAAGAAQATEAQAPAKANRAEPAIEYRIGPGDLLQIFVWKEPELTRDVMVRLDGRITVALLGDVEAAGRTPQQLGEELGKSLSKFLETPRVTVGIAQANSTRFYVLGMVGKSGEFPLSGRTTVLQGLALAGGFREFAKTDNIVIIRQEQGSQTVLPVNYKKLEDGKDMSQNVVLRPGDTIVVP
jgi:polysaccharide export outer membrane protein